MKLRLIVLCLCIALCILCGRSLDIADSGSGTQTTNGICISSHNGKVSGYVFTIDPEDSITETPMAAMSLSIHLFSSEYQPYNHNGFSMTLVPDSTGKFHCDTVLSGIFTVLAYDTKDTVGVFFNGIPVNDSVKEYIARKIFSPYGSISGIIRDTSLIQADYRGAYILGTPFFELTDTTDSFSLLNVPVGSYLVRSDYFKNISDTIFQRAKGYFRTLDTLVIYTDSMKVDIRSDSLLQRIELSL